MMRVLILSQYFAPEKALIPSDLAQSLAASGHNVRVLTGFPNYPAGKLFPGYRQKWRQRNTENGIEICRVPLYIDHSQRGWARMLNYMTFALTSASARRFARGVDVVYVYATQMTPALGPWLWRMTGGAPYVLHIQDLWPDSIVGSSLAGGGKSSRIIEAILNPWLRQVYRRAAAVVAIAPTMLKTLESRGVNESQSRLVYNWAREISAEPNQQPMSAFRKRTRVIYAGNMGDMQDLETVIRAAVRAVDSGVELLLIGEGVVKPQLVQLAKELNATNIEFRDSIEPNEMSSVYENADFGLVTLKDLPAFRGTVPSKFQALLAHGVPVLTTVQGDVKKICTEQQVGFAADPESVHEMEHLLREASNCSEQHRIVMARRGWDLARNWFSLEAAMNAFESILQDAATEGKK